MTNHAKEIDPVIAPKDVANFPTADEQVYRIGGTTSGAAIFGGALASYIGFAVIGGAIAGGLLGLAISVFAASHALARKA